MSKKLFGWLAGIEITIFTLLQGSAVTLGLLVAPIVFTTIRGNKLASSPNELAGQVFGNILHIWFWFSLICAVILLGTAAFTLRKIKPLSRLLLWRLVTNGIIVALLVAFGWTLFRLDAITAGLSKPIDDYPAGVNPRQEFDFLHALSTDLISIALLVGAAWLVLSVLATVKLSGTRTTTVDSNTAVASIEPLAAFK
jgi:hypothetical protein